MEDVRISEKPESPPKDAASAPEQLENGYQHETTSFSENLDDESDENTNHTRTTRQRREEKVLVAPVSETIIEEELVPENVIIETPSLDNTDFIGIRDRISDVKTAQLREEEVLAPSISGSIVIEEMPIPENIILEMPRVEYIDNNGEGETLIISERAELKEEVILVPSISENVIIEEVPDPENVIIETPYVENSDDIVARDGSINAKVAQLREEEVLVSSVSESVIIQEMPEPENVIIETPYVENSDDIVARDGPINANVAQLREEEVLVSSVSESVIIQEMPEPENVIIETPYVENSDDNVAPDVSTNPKVAQLQEEEVLVSSVSESVIIQEMPEPENVIIETPYVENSDDNVEPDVSTNPKVAQLQEEEVLVSSVSESVIIQEMPEPENVIIETPYVENSDDNVAPDVSTNPKVAQLREEEVLVSSVSESVIIQEMPEPENVIIETPYVENSDDIVAPDVSTNPKVAQIREEEVLVPSVYGNFIIQEMPEPENVIIETPVGEISGNNEVEIISEPNTTELRDEDISVVTLVGSVVVQEVPVAESFIVETPVIENSDNNEIEKLSETNTAEMRKEDVSVASLVGSVVVQEVPIAESSIVETPAVASLIAERPTIGAIMSRPVVANVNFPEVVPVVELRNGVVVPAIGFGTWEIEPDEVYHAVKNAINSGFRHIDCALIYQNERDVGAAINDSIRDGVVTREDLFITSKLWNTFHKPNLVESSCRQSLRDLGLDYLDLYLIHTPIGFREGKNLIPKIAGVIQYSHTDYLETWYAMEMLVKKGLVKSIGLSNFNSQQVKRVVSKAKVRPVTNQVECHPLLNQNRLSDCCKELGIVLTAYSSLCTGGQLLEDPKVVSLSQKYGRTPAQVLLRYQLDKGNIVLTRSCQPERMLEALAVGQFQLEREDIKLLDSLNRNKRYHNLVGYGESHKEYPFKIPF